MIPRNVLVIAGAALLGAALAEELLKEADERTWEGKVFGLVPYDLRLFTPEGFQRAREHPDEARVVLGTKVDLARAAKLAKRALPF